jgi:hypothetical protein
MENNYKYMIINALNTFYRLLLGKISDFLLQQMAKFVFFCRNYYLHFCIVNSFKSYTHMRGKAIHRTNSQKSTLIPVRWVALFLFCGVCNALFSQGWITTYGLKSGNLSYNDFAAGSVQMGDGGYWTIGSSESTSNSRDFLFLRTDVDGNILDTITTGGPRQEVAYAITQSQGWVWGAGYSTSFNPNANNEVYISGIRREGVLRLEKTILTPGPGEARTLFTAANGDLLIGGSFRNAQGFSQGFIARLSAPAYDQVKWTSIYGIQTQNHQIFDIKEGSGGEIFACGLSYNTQLQSTDGFFTRLNADGAILKTVFAGHPRTNQFKAITLLPNGKVLLGGSALGSSQDVFLMHADTSGIINWKKTFGSIYGEDIYSIIPEGNRYLLVGNVETSDTSAIGGIFSVSAVGDSLSLLNLGQAAYGEANTGIRTRDGGVLTTMTSYSAFGYQVNDFKLAKLDSKGKLYRARVKGKVFSDLNSNCRKDLNEDGLAGIIIEAQSNSETLYATTDADGNFSLNLDRSNYRLKSITKGDYWKPCQNSYDVNVNVDTARFNLDFALYPNIQFPQIETSISGYGLYPCKPSRYFIDYKNIGTTTSLSSSIELSLGDSVILQNSNRLFSSLGGGKFSFPIGNISVSSEGKFWVDLFLTCNGNIQGEVKRLQVKASPSSFQSTPANWDKSSLQVEGRCDQDSVRFLIKNIGSGDMISARTAIVIEDQIMPLILNGVTIRANSTHAVSLDATGKTYRLIIPQSDFHPGRSKNPTFAVEGCPKGQSFTTGMVRSFTEDDEDYFIDIDQAETRTILPNSLVDPQPVGLGLDHLIPQNQDIEYTWIAKVPGEFLPGMKIYLSDTLSSLLDASGIRIGVSSHPVNFTLKGKSVIEFIFEGISSSDSVLMVKFRVPQKNNIPKGSKIYSNPTLTLFPSGVGPKDFPEIFHTIGGKEPKDYVTITFVEEFNKPLPYKAYVFPNPFELETTIGIQEWTGGNWLLEVTDISGRLVETMEVSGDKTLFSKGEKPSGLYFINIKQGSKLLAAGKMIIP